MQGSFLVAPLQVQSVASSRRLNLFDVPRDPVFGFLEGACEPHMTHHVVRV